MDVLLLDYKDNKFYLFFLFGIIMSIPKNMYELSIEKMQQSINRLENQLERSKQLLSHDIVVDNRTNHNLNFTIKVSEEAEPYQIN